jgi:nicotinamidase-related amidase
MTTTLLIIDPQRDFMDERDSPVPIKGAVTDMMNLTDNLIYQYGENIDRVVVCLDQHTPHHIADPIMWLDRRNRNPKPYTQITHADVVSGKWRAASEALQEIQADYVRDAEAAGPGLTIWPRHCVIGSRGAAMCPRLAMDLLAWSSPTRHLHFFPKSQNWSTEHLSSFQTIVPRYDDGTTWFNNYLYSAIQADTILIAGEALSHGVRATVLDAINYAPDQKLIDRMVLLEDCTSAMPGHRVAADEFLHEFASRGGRFGRSDAYYRDLSD